MARVLVVDADADIRTSLIDLLSLEGYSVLEAATPGEALEILRTCPDCIVVIFDSGLPTMNDEGIISVATVALGLDRDAWRQDVPRQDVSRQDVSRQDVSRQDVSRQHAFICLTTSPQHLHHRVRDVLGTGSIPIIQKPFDLDALLAAVAGAVIAVDARNHKQKHTLSHEPGSRP